MFSEPLFHFRHTAPFHSTPKSRGVLQLHGDRCSVHSAGDCRRYVLISVWKCMVCFYDLVQYALIVGPNHKLPQHGWLVLCVGVLFCPVRSEGVFIYAAMILPPSFLQCPCGSLCQQLPSTAFWEGGCLMHSRRVSHWERL